MNTVRVRILKDLLRCVSDDGTRHYYCRKGDIVEIRIQSADAVVRGFHLMNLRPQAFEVIDERAEADAEWSAIVEAMAEPAVIGVSMFPGEPRE